MLDPKRCPLCQGANQCSQATNNQTVDDCWCFHQPISHEALAQLPEALRHQSCLCPQCAERLESFKA